MHHRGEQRIANENGSRTGQVNTEPVEMGPPVFGRLEDQLLGEQKLQLQDSRAGHEAALVDEARSGNQDAFSDLVSGQFKTMFRLALRITRNREDAEDAVQDAILKAHANLSQFEGRARFSTWISRIAINEALIVRRKQRHGKRVGWEELTSAGELSVATVEWRLYQANPEVRYARIEVRERMLRAARRLRPKYQAVFFMARVKGCTHEETAQKLELSVATVKARLHRAYKQMREKLTARGETLPC